MSRLKIIIETSTSCIGVCVGCALTPLENCLYCNYSKECFESSLPLLNEKFIVDNNCYNPLIPFYENRKNIKNDFLDRELIDWEIKK